MLPNNTLLPVVGWRVHKWVATLAPNSPNMAVVERGIIWRVCEGQVLWSHLSCKERQHATLIQVTPGALAVVDAKDVHLQEVDPMKCPQCGERLMSPDGECSNTACPRY